MRYLGRVAGVVHRNQQGMDGSRTVSEVAASSDSVLPTSLLVHSCMLASPELELTAGTTRGIVLDR